MTSTTNTTNKPLRRVGTLTLGVCLIAAGTLFLLARFLPGLPWLVIGRCYRRRGSSCSGVKCSTTRPGPAHAGATSAQGCSAC